MDTVEFIELIAPFEGWLCLALPYPQGGYKHMYFQTAEEMAARIALLDSKGLTVYHACASFVDKSSRKQVNVAWVRSFWLDVDTGPGKPYADVNTATRAVIDFQQAVGLPQPYIIASGNGVHVYWPLAADLDPELWRTTASMLKTACGVYGLGADPSRTSDHASILRPVGSTHRKDPVNPRTVALEVGGVTSDIAEIDARLLAYLTEHNAKVAPVDDFQLEGVRPAGFDAAGNSDLTGGMDYAPKFADAVAEGCAIISELRDTKGNVEQPVWFAALGVLAFCEDGDEKAHAWSSGHPQYSIQETDTKLAQVRAKQSGPTTCAKLGEFRPNMCGVCPHAGRIKTPATLGLQATPVIPAPVPQSKPSGSFKAFQKPKCPTGYDRAIDPITGRLALKYGVTTREDDNSPWTTEWFTFCHTDFYPVSRLDMDGEAVVEFERVLPQGMGVRRFSIPGSGIGKGREGWAGILGANEISVETKLESDKMDAMLKRWMHQLTITAAQVQSHKAFGWTDTGREFVIGERVIQAGGAEARAIVTGPAKQTASAFDLKGDLQTWVDVIDRAYNAPGQEGYQFMVAAGFAAPLMQLIPGVNGVTVYAHSAGSGIGKTTAARAALSAWGDPDDLQLSEGKATQGSLWALMGTYKSIPVVFDELTNMDPRAASELVFSVSSGRAKQRLKSDGDLRQNNSNWRTIMLATGNNPLSEKLSQHRGNAEAEMSRLFEYVLQAKPHLTPNEVLDLFPKLSTNHGHAGEAYIRYVIDNYDAVVSQLNQVRAAFNTAAGITQKERFWSAMLASTLVAVAICNRLGVLKFKPGPLKTWMIERLQENRSTRVAVTNDPLELVGKMLADLWQGVLVTRGEGDLRRNVSATVLNRPTGVMVGRAIMPDLVGNIPNPTQTTVLFLNEQSLKDWASKKGVSASEMHNAAVSAGWAAAALERYALGRGTIEYGAASSYIKCVKLFPDMIGGSATGSSGIQRLNLVGDRNNASGSAHQRPA